MAVDDLIAEIEKLSVLDLVKLSKALQDKWGVSAAPVAVAAGPAVAAGAAKRFRSGRKHGRSATIAVDHLGIGRAEFGLDLGSAVETGKDFFTIGSIRSCTSQIVFQRPLPATR